MRVELIKHPMRQCGGIEDAVAAMHHMIVEPQHHESRIVNDAAENAGVHCVKVRGLAVNRFVEADSRLFAIENRSAGHD